MEAKNDILEEVRSLSALVATISRETPYRVPAGYFINFPELVLERAVTTLTITTPLTTTTPVIAASKPLTFSVPDGYFEGFAQQMLARIKSLPEGANSTTGSSAGSGKPEEQEELPAILAQAARINPYTVPDGYFDELSPILAILKDKNAYAVPVGYFDRLADEIAMKTSAPVAAGSPMPASNVRPLLRAEPAEESGSNSRPKAKVVSFGKRMNWLKYSAAAVVAGLMVTVGWLRWQTANAPSGASASVAAASSTQAPVDIAKNLSKVSDEELQNFLVDQDTDTTLAQPVTNNALMATVDMDDTNLKSLLGDVSDGELKQYMDEHGGANDIATN